MEIIKHQGVKIEKAKNGQCWFNMRFYYDNPELAMDAVEKLSVKAEDIACDYSVKKEKRKKAGFFKNK